MQEGDATVRDLYADLLSAWNNRDARSFAALFDERGQSIGFDGSQMAGRDEIARTLETIFRDHPTASYVGKVQGVDILTDSVAIVRAIAGMIPPGKAELMPERNAVQTLVARKADDGWRIALWQNTPAAFDGRPELVEKMTAELRAVQRSTG